MFNRLKFGKVRGSIKVGKKHKDEEKSSNGFDYGGKWTKIGERFLENSIKLCANGKGGLVSGNKTMKRQKIIDPIDDKKYMLLTKL